VVSEFLSAPGLFKPKGNPMNWILKSASVGAMVGSLAAPLYRAQNPTVGVVLDAESARVSNDLLTSGTSLYSADVVKTESQGSTAGSPDATPTGRSVRGSLFSRSEWGCYGVAARNNGRRS
jgi:hypothetical protein